MPDRELLDLATDEALSALVDGELDTAAERALRERAASEPALARRLAELEAVGSQLRALPVPEVPADLRARLRARIAAGDGVARQPQRRMRGAPWAVAGGLALAAGLALYLVVGSPRDPALREAEDVEIARVREGDGSGELAAVPKVEPGGEPLVDAAELDPGESELADDELAIALEFDALRDFELIDQLELLEALASIDDAETAG